MALDALTPELEEEVALVVLDARIDAMRVDRRDSLVDIGVDVAAVGCANSAVVTTWRRS